MTSPTVGISIGAMGFTILGTLLWPVLTRKFNSRRLKRREQKRQKKYSEYLAQKQHLLEFIKANQKQTLLENYPAPQTCAQIIEQRGEELWQRSVSHDDFLTVRLGTGRAETRLEINRPREQFSINDDDALFLAMKKSSMTHYILRMLRLLTA